MRRTNSFVILVGAILILAFIGTRINDFLGTPSHRQDEIQNVEKFNEIVNYISAFYVDDVRWNQAMMGAIDGLLTELDPHSVYISSQDAALNEENFQGTYQGIGIHFDVIDDYLTVITAIPGSPAEKLGLLPGDRIVSINGESAVGISNADVPNKLKGPKGSSVEISVIREGVDEQLDFMIVRDDIPIFTINTSFLTKDSTGYISLSRFAKITEEEMEEALAELTERGMKRLILDLRWNAGGYLDQAVKLVSFFLDGHKKVVYTEGRLSEFNEDFYTDTFRQTQVYNLPLVVLINRSSASASEIVAGAIQDYDRGLIVGTTSFGKGLVQREFPLNDKSRLRLTISKYYTPSGRLIQRPYKGKKVDQYYAASLDSMENETTSIDSIGEQPVYFTSGGRKVFGGGGIQPDVTVKYISNDAASSLVQKFFQKRLFFEIASRYANAHPELENSFENYLDRFEVDRSLLQDLENLAREKDIQFAHSEYQKSYPYIKSRLKAEIARSLWGTKHYYHVLLLDDNQFNEALGLFDQIGELLITDSPAKLVKK